MACSPNYNHICFESEYWSPWSFKRVELVRVESTSAPFEAILETNCSGRCLTIFQRDTDMSASWIWNLNEHDEAYLFCRSIRLSFKIISRIQRVIGVGNLLSLHLRTIPFVISALIFASSSGYCRLRSCSIGLELSCCYFWIHSRYAVSSEDRFARDAELFPTGLTRYFVLGQLIGMIFGRVA
jgi:hypothetical protein